jgi:hypothetical protein
MKLAKQITFKVYGPDNRSYEKLRFRADKGQNYSKAKIEHIKTAFVSHLQDSFPEVVFRVIQTSKAEFSVVHNGGNA